MRANSSDEFDTYLVLTFVGETRVLAINAEDELDEAALAGFDADAQVSSGVVHAKLLSVQIRFYPS